MRPIDSSYDRNTAETRSADPGKATYALISDHGGPCSVVAEMASLADAIEAARILDTDSAPTDLEDEIDVCADGQSVEWLVEQAEEHGWRQVASAPAGEYWTVLVQNAAAPDVTDETEAQAEPTMSSPKTPKPQPNQEQLLALRDYAKHFGRQWKARLNADWMRAGANCAWPEARERYGLLQQVRNQFGPSWLVKFKGVVTITVTTTPLGDENDGESVEVTVSDDGGEVDDALIEPGDDGEINPTDIDTEVDDRHHTYGPRCVVVRH